MHWHFDLYSALIGGVASAVVIGGLIALLIAFMRGLDFG